MFKSFIKGVTSDRDDKEKRKRDKKKDKQKMDRGSLSAEDLLRLEVSSIMFYHHLHFVSTSGYRNDVFY